MPLYVIFLFFLALHEEVAHQILIATPEVEQSHYQSDAGKDGTKEPTNVWEEIKDRVDLAEVVLPVRWNLKRYRILPVVRVRHSSTRLAHHLEAI